jgi:hypothetical protein
MEGGQQKAIIGLRDDTMRDLEMLLVDRYVAEQMMRKEPQHARFIATVLPHELGHGVRVHATPKPGYLPGQPLRRTYQFTDDEYRELPGKLHRRITKELRTPGAGNIPEDVKRWVRMRSTGGTPYYPETMQPDEAVIQAAAINQARQAGLLPRQKAPALRRVLEGGGLAQ